MCGIFGLLHKNKLIDLKKIKIEKILSHRGPDDQGWLLSDGLNCTTGKSLLPDVKAKILLIHKRLSILDRSEWGWQPMCCSDNRYYLLFNGEIYNYLELKKELSEQGIVFNSTSDSEVLLKAYLHWGNKCLEKFIGMFAFVIFDSRQQKFFLARDPFGIKPFYYYFCNDKFIFSSEIKTLVNFVSTKSINKERLFFYLRSGTTDFTDETLFSAIKQVPAGHFIEFNLNEFSCTPPICYWRVTAATNQTISFHEAALQLRKLFLENIELHMRSDFQVAATLSGGIDSSSIVMGMKYLYPNRLIKTFSYIADEQSINEEKWIDLVNSETKAESHKVFAHPNALIADFERLIGVQDEPFGSTSIYAQHCVFKMAKHQGVKVMLDGQGADEMLGGYTFYLAARFASLIKNFNFTNALNFLKNNSQKQQLLAQAVQYLLPPRTQAMIRSLMGFHYIPPWLNASWFTDRDYLNPLKTRYSKHVLQDHLLETFTRTSLPMLLRYQDRNSMAYSIESRVPFLTPKIVNFIFSLPEEFLISKNGETKAVFREAMRGIVPDQILDRRDKIGFATPEKNWLSTLKPWVENILLSDYAKSLPVFNHQALLTDWRNLLQGNARFDFRFWRWINFIKWSEIYQVEI